MKKSVFVVVLAMVLLGLLFTTGCKKIELDGLEWYLVEGSGSYSSLDNTSSLKINAWVSIGQPNIASGDPLKASLVLWQIILNNGQVLSQELNNENFRSVLGNVYASVSSWQEDWLWIQLEVPSQDGDLFNGIDPDEMQMQILVEDSEGNTYSLVTAAAFEFTRN